MNSRRIEYFDIARGIGILLVVLGHNDFGAFSPFLHRLIYSFHIPLFFFLSGYFLNTAMPFTQYFRKRFHSVLKPFLFTILLIYFASVSFEKMGFATALTRIVKSLYGSVTYITWDPLWFLPNLFVVSLYAYAFIRMTSRLPGREWRWAALLGTLAMAYPVIHAFNPFSLSILGRQYELFGLPFSLDLVFLSGFFFLAGSEVRQLTSEGSFDSPLLLAGAGAGLLLLNILFPYRTDIAIRLYESFPVNTAEAALGILFVLALSRQIEMRSRALARVLRYIGNISLILLLFHVPIQEFWGEKTLALTGHFPLSILVGFIMGVVGPVLIYEIFIRYNPVAAYWFGRKAEVRRPEELPVQKGRNAAAPAGTPVVEIKEQ
ncbi:MAG: acyltransferase family protein [Chloroflexota bacterium]|nr:acyltransferase family protein [Chloroflexota bacterium]